MTVQRSAESHLWRRFVRFSVRGLIGLVLVIGVGLGWVVRSAHVQRDLVAAIERAGGRVTYGWEWQNGDEIPGGKPWPPRWLVDLIGVDHFGHVAVVWLATPLVTDQTLERIGQLTRLERLCLFC